ncbi:MAG: hypothetical protein QXR26_05765 [Candidatus Caldarchaeum sp.]
MSKVVERVLGWVARFLLPEIRALIREETKDLRVYIDDRLKAFDERLASLRSEMVARLDSLEKRLGSKTA